MLGNLSTTSPNTISDQETTASPSTKRVPAVPTTLGTSAKPRTTSAMASVSLPSSWDRYIGQVCNVRRKDLLHVKFQVLCGTQEFFSKALRGDLFVCYATRAQKTNEHDILLAPCGYVYIQEFYFSIRFSIGKQT
jgi:hypothetical protein